MEREITEFRDTREQQLQQQVASYREMILKEITDVVMERVKANNLDLVFDKSGPGPSGISPILFSQESADFTADVLAAVQKRAAAPANPKPSKP
jgi:Skp family chaperone for outer membrane proteins